MVLATESLVAVKNTECLHELEVEINSMASTNATWLYQSNPESACTLLWWQHGADLDFFAAPCYQSGRAEDAASGLPCNSLPLVGQVRLDVCGSDAMTTSQAQDAPQAALLECLGPITATTMAPTPSSPLEECINEVLSDPVVVMITDCVNDLQNPPPDDAPMSLESTTCPVGLGVCPSPILDLDEPSVCGIGAPIPEIGFCDSSETGITVNDFPVCITVTICPSPQIGIKVNGIGYCQNPVNFCNYPEIGVQPNCIDPNDYVCGDAEVGLRPLCIAQPALCDYPEVGVDPTCVNPLESLCPLPAIGVQPNCFDAVELVYEAVGIVLGVVNNGGCRPGTMPYTSDDFTWCASSGEMAQDGIPDDEVPVAFDSDPENDPEALLVDEALPWPELTESLVPLMAIDDEADCSDLTTTCTVVFVRGYDGFSTTGYGGYAPMTTWFESRGYEVEQVDTYGRCVGTVNPMSHGDQGTTDAHDVWLPKGHPSGSGCSGHGEHSTDTDLRHLAYHLAWWIYDAHLTNPVDVVAHSMGGLLTRYALAMVEAKNEQWPPLLAIEDVVTLGTPHLGIRWNVPTPDRQSNQMEPGSGTMKGFKTSAQNPQGLSGTDWTLIGADEDSTVEESSGIGMDAQHKLWYDENEGGHEDCAYGHNEYYKDDDGDMDCSYYWTKRSSGANGHSYEGPHSIKRTWWGVTSPGY